METEQSTLYYRQGGSDKIYRASLEPKDGGFVVNFAYGRRGSTPTTGTKTASPVDYPAAKAIYDQLIRQKTAKGYTPGEEGTPYRQTENEQRDSGVLCQLLHPVAGEEQVAALLEDHDFCLQEKFDGRRLLIRKEGTTIEGINRRGLIVGLAEPVFRAVRDTIADDCILDGESLGDTCVVFDLLRYRGTDLRSRPYGDRLALLRSLVGTTQSSAPLRRIETVFEQTQKRKFIQNLREANAEGGVFKRLDATYTPGRANAADQFKYKFCQTASFVVERANTGRRSVALQLHQEGQPVPAGNVTIPANHPVPPAGAIVEVRYLYAHRESGSVYQPVYLGVRDDIPASDCTVGQLKYRAETADAVSV